MSEDLAAFTEAAFDVLQGGGRFKANWHIRAIAHLLQRVAMGLEKRVIINMPPRAAKSMFASIALPAWLLGRDPTESIICLSYARDLAVKLSNDTRTLMTSPLYAAAFPGTRLSARKNTETDFETTRGGFRMASSVGGPLTGRGARFIVIDDPIKPMDALSDTVRSNTNLWFDQTVLSRLNDKTDGAIVVVMQRLHIDDLAGHLMARGGWTVLNLPAIADVDERIPLGFGKFHRRRAGELLHPEREPQGVLDELKAGLGTRGFAAQYQQQPVPAGGNLIDWAWFRRFDARPPRQPYESIVQSWDTASKVGEMNDYSVCTTWLVQDEAYYLLDLHRERLDMPNLRRRAIALHDHYRPEAVLIEDKASGTALIQELHHTTRMPVIAVEPQGDKVVRAGAQAMRIEGGQVYLPTTAPWLDELQREVLAFPHGTHDDQVDSLSQFLIYIVDQQRDVPRIRSLDWD